MSSRRAFWLLLVLAAVLRFAVPGTPPGMHIDEASNAWNARCIGQTMFDEHRTMLPVFYTRAFNDNRSPLFLYFAAPFEMAIGPYGVRWPAFLSGVTATLLLWQWVRTLAGERAGLIAGLVWAVDPTFVQLTRWGHEASVTPALVLGAMCLWQRAGLLWARENAGLSTPLRWAFTAGVFSGFACYGYASVRLYLPAWLGMSVVAQCFWGRARASTDSIATSTSYPKPTAEPWAFVPWAFVRRWTCAAVGFLLLFAPLVYVHLTDPAINERARQTWTWEPTDPPPVVLGKLAVRYARHYDPRFLFLQGTADPLLSTLAPPAPFGALPWAWGPLILLGVIAAVKRFRRDRLARFALLALAIYPAGDVLNALGPPNVLRSLVGWWAFAVVITVGIEWIAAMTVDAAGSIRLQMFATAAAVLFAVPNVAVLLWRWGTEPAQQVLRGVDFEQACATIRPVLSNYDAVVFTTTDTPFAYAQVLCFLDYPPEKFLTQPILRARATDTKRTSPELLVNTGPLYFQYAIDELPAILNAAVAGGLRGRTLWVLRPTDPKRSPDDRLLQTITLSDGTPSLLILEHQRRPDER